MSESKLRQDRRPRKELVLKVTYDDPQRLLADYLTNFSEGGLFICTTADFAVGERISFTVSFPGLLEPIRIVGIVRWRRDPIPGDTGDKPSGVGVEFDHSTAEHRESVAKLIEKLSLVDKPALAPDRP